MHRAWPEPDAVFSPNVWAELEAILRRRIPANGKREICEAMSDYDLTRVTNEQAIYEASEKLTRRRVDPKAKGRAALSNFIKYARGLRHAFYSVEKYLNKEDLIIEAEQLNERIYKFQKLAQHELDKKSRGGRPGKKIRDDLVIRLGVIYEQLTNKKPTRSGQFAKFVYTIFQAQGIPLIGLPNAMEKAVRYAKNRR